ncbi:MAG TPA: hypothetical protein VIY47_14835 [Ignavibacteriaceae bacterium]
MGSKNIDFGEKPMMKVILWNQNGEIIHSKGMPSELADKFATRINMSYGDQVCIAACSSALSIIKKDPSFGPPPTGFDVKKIIDSFCPEKTMDMVLNASGVAIVVQSLAKRNPVQNISSPYSLS